MAESYSELFRQLNRTSLLAAILRAATKAISIRFGEEKKRRNNAHRSFHHGATLKIPTPCQRERVNYTDKVNKPSDIVSSFSSSLIQQKPDRLAPVQMQV